MLAVIMDGRTRCRWVRTDDPVYLKYHDTEWGVPVHSDMLLFEFMILEGAQAGLNWRTILAKRESYRKAFDGFDPCLVSRYGDEKIQSLLENPGIIRNRLKVRSAIGNAASFLSVIEEFGSFDSYVWGFVGGSPKTNAWKSTDEIPSRTPESDAMSRDLLKRGFRFVGSTICYAYMQAVGMVNDHTVSCFRYSEV